VRVDRHAAPVVEHAEKAVLLERDLDEGRMARDRLVHGVVDHLGEEMMQGVGVGSANKHARAATHRLKPLQNLNRGGCVVGLAGGAVARRRPGFHRDGFGALGRRGAEKIIHVDFTRTAIRPAERIARRRGERNANI